MQFNPLKHFNAHSQGNYLNKKQCYLHDSNTLSLTFIFRWALLFNYFAFLFSKSSLQDTYKTFLRKMQRSVHIIYYKELCHMNCFLLMKYIFSRIFIIFFFKLKMHKSHSIGALGHNKKSFFVNIKCKRINFLSALYNLLSLNRCKKHVECIFVKHIFCIHI